MSERGEETRAEVQIIHHGSPAWRVMDDLCFKSKNLYNACLYDVRQEYFKTGHYKTWQSQSKDFKNTHNPDYYALPTKVSKEILMQTGRCFSSFFALLGKKLAGKYDKPVHLPGYKHSTLGRNTVTFQAQTIKRSPEPRNGLYEYTVCPRSLNLSFKSKRPDVMMIRVSPLATGAYKVTLLYKKIVPEHSVSDDAEKVWAAGDIGLNNLITVMSQAGGSFIINGKPLKSMNQYYNKNLAHLQSDWDERRGEGDPKYTRRMRSLTQKRNQKTDGYLHDASRLLVNQLVSSNVTDFAVGYNEGWKQDASMGHRSNQAFVQVAYRRLLDMVVYKCADAGIRVHEHEESYTSKCSLLDMEPVCKHEEYLGRRVHRGLFRTARGVMANADCNGAGNILRKVAGNDAILAFDSVLDAAVRPVRLTPYEH